MAACSKNISSHALKLMTSLNLQREQAQFCDCVVIQKLNPAHIFPAHRCVLSASSPVLASILSSSGALVELRDPCLSDSVLETLLHYIYTGSMKYMHTREQYDSLLTAATYLQMDKLQETLKAWPPTEVTAAGETDDFTEADHQPNKHVRDAQSTSCNSFGKHIPLFHSCSESSSIGEDHSPASNVDTFSGIDMTVKQQEETSREGAENEHIDGKETNEAQICCSPLPCLSAVPDLQWTSSSSSSPLCSGAVSVICHSSNAPMPKLTESSTKPHYLSLSKAPLNFSLTSRGTDKELSISDSHRDRNQELSHKSKGSIADCGQIGDDADQYDPSSHSDFTENQSIPEPQNRLCRNIIRGSKNKTDLTFEELPCKHQRLDSSESHKVLAKSVHSVPLPTLNTNTGSNLHCEYFSPKGEVKDEHLPSKGLLATVERQHSNCKPDKPQTDMCPTVQKAETSTNGSFDICSCVPTTPESSQGDITDHESNVVWQSYRGHLQYHCMPQEDTRISDRDLDHKLNHSNQPSDEEEVSSYHDEEALRQNFARQTTERIVLLDISATPAELLVTYNRRSEREENLTEYDQKSRENIDRVQWGKATLAGVLHEKKCAPTESFDGAESKSLFEAINFSEEGKHRSCPDTEDLQKAKAIEVGNHTSTLTVCSQRPDSEFVQGPMTPTSPDFTPFTPLAAMKANKSAPLSTHTQHPFKCYLCDRSFSQRGSLNRHVRSHLGVRPFPCPNCPMTFSRQYRVTEHMRVHQRCSLGTDFVKPSASPT